MSKINKNFSLSSNIVEKLKLEDNASGLIESLLENFYTQNEHKTTILEVGTAKEAEFAKKKAELEQLEQSWKEENIKKSEYISISQLFPELDQYLFDKFFILINAPDLNFTHLRAFCINYSLKIEGHLTVSKICDRLIKYGLFKAEKWEKFVNV